MVFQQITRHTQLNRGKYSLKWSDGSISKCIWFHFLLPVNTIMDVKRIYFTRHGESRGNKDGLICGELDTPLTEYGEKQAECLGESLKDVGIELIISSDLRRAKKTAEIITSHIGVDILYDSRLRERSCGKFDGKVHKDIKDDKEWRKFLTTFDYSVENGESIIQLHNRVGSFIDELIRERDFSNILLSAHGGVLWVLVPYILGMPIQEYKGKIGMDNCGLSVFTWDEGFALERLNCVSHLGKSGNGKPSWRF